MKAKIVIDGERNAEIKLYPTNRFEKDLVGNLAFDDLTVSVEDESEARFNDHQHILIEIKEKEGK